jgi:hypothetical protein
MQHHLCKYLSNIFGATACGGMIPAIIDHGIVAFNASIHITIKLILVHRSELVISLEKPDFYDIIGKVIKRHLIC